MAKMPIVTPNNERVVRSIFDRRASTADARLSPIRRSNKIILTKSNLKKWNSTVFTQRSSPVTDKSLSLQTASEIHLEITLISVTVHEAI
jgi:hypothetical protein